MSGNERDNRSDSFAQGVWCAESCQVGGQAPLR